MTNPTVMAALSLAVLATFALAMTLVAVRVFSRSVARGCAFCRDLRPASIRCGFADQGDAAVGARGSSPFETDDAPDLIGGGCRRRGAPHAHDCFGAVVVVPSQGAAMAPPLSVVGRGVLWGEHFDAGRVKCRTEVLRG
jgi:hypothetical protein